MSRVSVSRGESGPHGFEPWSSQANDIKINTCHFLARYSALLGQGNDWLAQSEDNVTEWDISTIKSP